MNNGSKKNEGKMNYFIDLFSPDTYEHFNESDRSISGFRLSQKPFAKKIKAGDKLVCYLTKLSRWIGVLEVLDTFFIDDSPIFSADSDEFVVRFKVRPLCWLQKELAIPIHEPVIWNGLSFTKDLD